ncbi:MAG TPA: YafY family protein [Luteibacter sp.]|uniref:helix-turn-helix transcriptional regulator n=1 Tax=Luteibacter sp. TaxID=1886636 RepID=UPI002BDC4F40|nr:YafY family protein [Luteibacter sp.]HVI56483.1 YafY family protein [Luteibacter sp.]
MSRTNRLFDLIQSLRARRRPVTAVELAEELGVSKRTVHRDLDTLRTLGAPVDGAAGLGYLLRPGFLLPPLMMTEEELDALSLGAQWVRQRGDPALAAAATNALTKIEAVLPDGMADVLGQPALVTARVDVTPPEVADIAVLRRAIRERRKLIVSYTSIAGHASTRVIWPISLAYFDTTRLLAAWCEERQAFRHFRTDRLDAVTTSTQRYPAQRVQLLKAWRASDPMRGLTVDGN